MKKIILLFLLFSNFVFSQNQDLDATLQKIISEKNDNKRIDLINTFFLNIEDIDPKLGLLNAKKLLEYAKKNDDKIGKALAYLNISNSYSNLGDLENGLKFIYESNSIAQEIKNEKLIANINTILAYHINDKNYSRKIKLCNQAINTGKKLKDSLLLIKAYETISDIYLDQNKYDSTLIYSQRCYDLGIKNRNYNRISYILNNFSFVNGILGNKDLAHTYYRMSIKEGVKSKSPLILGYSYLFYARYFLKLNQKDSSEYYAKKQIKVLDNTPFEVSKIDPAHLLSLIYKKNNIDSCYKYSEMFHNIKDSLFSYETAQKTQLMAIEENLKQEKIDEKNKQSLQFSLIAIGLLSVIILFLMLSRSLIISSKFIKFFGIIILLIVFEFLNLLLHPFLEEVTHHSPIFMLFGLVGIAALLVPLHHKVEHWATAKLVEKNKQIRLANAKKTIEELEKKE